MFGPLLVLIALYARGGIASLLGRRRWLSRCSRTDRLVKRFGGLLATDNVSIDVRPGEIHALIGPNGAGKTTLVGQLTGNLAPDSGTIHFAGRDVTRLPTHARVRLGLGALVPDHLGAARVHRARQRGARRPGACRPLLPLPARRAQGRSAARRRRSAASRRSASARAPTRWPPALSHGEQRQLEIAMALAGEPRLLLLDEPMAGMGVEESQRMIAFLHGLKSQRAMLLIEHDMDAVFALADRITVLVYGRAIASRHARRDPRQPRGAPGLSRRGDRVMLRVTRPRRLLRREPGAVRHGVRASMPARS